MTPLAPAGARQEAKAWTSRGFPFWRRWRSSAAEATWSMDRRGTGRDAGSIRGLGNRRESQGVLTDAQDLMAEAVDAEQAFFSTCGRDDADASMKTLRVVAE